VKIMGCLQETENRDLSHETVTRGVKAILESGQHDKGCYLLSEVQPNRRG
jgi:hypothetical protein